MRTEPPCAEAPPDQRGDGPVRVLLVEDDPVVQALAMAVLMADERFRVVACTDSVSATLAVLSTGEVDVLLLDHDLPDGDAGAVVRHLQDAGSAGTSDVPVLLHTARDDAAVVASALGVPFRAKGDDWAGTLAQLARLAAARGSDGR